MQFFLPARISIVAPMAHVKPRGLNAGKVKDPSYTFRIPDEDRTIIEEAAALIGMPPSSFVRQASLAAAIEVHGHHERFKTRLKRNL